MEYELTPQRLAYLEARGHIVLSACPGSGKTTSIVRKLYDIAGYCNEKYGSHAGYACLSFTNTAAEELTEKYYQMHGERLHFPHVVSTIDSFIMQNVVLPFWYLCKFCGSKPIVVNEADVLDKIYNTYVWMNDHYDVYPAMIFRDYRTIFYQKRPALVEKAAQGYKWNHSVVTDNREQKYCDAAFKYRLSKGYITSTDALWMACHILLQHKWVAESLVARFPYIIVDEAQDNSQMQFVFFEILRKAGLENLEYVGDICQSIYEFRDARPDLLEKIMKMEGWTMLPLSECRRSNQRIINLYSKLKPAFIQTITSHGVKDLNIPIMVYKYDESNVKDIIRNFYSTCDSHQLEKRIILARGIPMCKHLAGVRDRNFEYWKSPLPNMLIEAKFAFDNNDMEKAFRKIRIVLAELMFNDDQYPQKKEFIVQIEKDIVYNGRIYEFLKIIPDFSLSFADWTAETEELLQKYWNLVNRPNLEAFKRKKGYTMKDMALKPVEQFYMSNNKESEFRKNVDTIHSVKGATMDAVLLFLSADSKSQNISLNDFPDKPLVSMKEGQRLIYVACSRASQYLALAVPSTVADEKIAIALKGIDYQIKKISLQQELDF